MYTVCLLELVAVGGLLSEIPAYQCREVEVVTIVGVFLSTPRATGSSPFDDHEQGIFLAHGFSSRVHTCLKESPPNMSGLSL